MQELLALTRNVVMGDLLSEEIWQADNASDQFGLGLLVSAKQKLRAEDLLGKELNDGATVLYQGEVPEHLSSGYFLPLIVVESRKFDNTLSCKEVFAPVLALKKVSDVYRAVEIINEKRIGIVAWIHTRNMNVAEFFIQQVLRTRVDVNRHGMGALWGTKFGGDQGSGSGNPSLDCEMVYNYVLWKTVYRTFGSL